MIHVLRYRNQDHRWSVTLVIGCEETARRIMAALVCEPDFRSLIYEHHSESPPRSKVDIERAHEFMTYLHFMSKINETRALEGKPSP